MEIDSDYLNIYVQIVAELSEVSKNNESGGQLLC